MCVLVSCVLRVVAGDKKSRVGRLGLLRHQHGHLTGIFVLSPFFLQRAFAISFCTSSLRTEMESKHCLEKILGPNENGPVKYAGQSDW